MKQILEYVGVSDVNMEEGSLRVDANISARRVRRDDARHEDGGEEHELLLVASCARSRSSSRGSAPCSTPAARIEQQTMLWDERAGQVRPARSKEGSHDYRYFPEPDLPPLVVPLTRIEALQDSLPELPSARRARYRREYAALTDYDIDVLTASPRHGRILRARRATERRPEDGGELDDGRGARRAECDRAIDRAFYRASGRPRGAARTWCATTS